MLRKLSPEEFEKELQVKGMDPFPADLEEKVREILHQVKKGGDAALMEYTRQFDHLQLTPKELEVSQAEAKRAWDELPLPLVRALERALERIGVYHQQEPIGGWQYRDDQGSLMGQLVRPLDRVGIYVPGGRAPLVSTVLMTVVPARLAGVREIILCTPPGADGRPDAHLLAAAWRAGADRIFAVGGAQAIAAMAYGTETIPKVDKIAGPGNAYVTLAKRLVFGQVGIDLLAGPSEVAILADETARAEEVAADLIAQAEHDPLARAVFITTSARLMEEVEESLSVRVNGLARREVVQAALAGGSAAILVPDLEAGLALANLMAPEHLEIITESPGEVVGRVRRAGAIFLGRFSPEALGDYLAGPSHVLPTGGTARFSSVLSVSDFVRRISLIAATPETFRQDARWAATLADLEGLTGHAAALRVRFQNEVSSKPDQMLREAAGGREGSFSKPAAGLDKGFSGGARPLTNSAVGAGHNGDAETTGRPVMLSQFSAEFARGPRLVHRQDLRRAEIARRTKETEVVLRLDLDGQGRTEIQTGLPFFDHLLEQIGRHAGFELEIRARGDLEVDQHHLVEDVGLCLGDALNQALGSKAGVNRYGHSLLPMDEALVLAAVDLSGRPHLAYEARFGAKRVGAFDLDLVEEFWRAVAASGRLTIHLRLLAGKNAHHMVESLFKGAGRALGQAARRELGQRGIPSTKGTL